MRLTPHLHNIPNVCSCQMPDTGCQLTPGAWLFVWGLPLCSCQSVEVTKYRSSKVSALPYLEKHKSRSQNYIESYKGGREKERTS